jgi:hypothetical protein
VAHLQQIFGSHIVFSHVVDEFNERDGVQLESFHKSLKVERMAVFGVSVEEFDTAGNLGASAMIRQTLNG